LLSFWVSCEFFYFILLNPLCWRNYSQVSPAEHEFLALIEREKYLCTCQIRISYNNERSLLWKINSLWSCCANIRCWNFARKLVIDLIVRLFWLFFFFLPENSTSKDGPNNWTAITIELPWDLSRSSYSVNVTIEGSCRQVQFYANLSFFNIIQFQLLQVVLTQIYICK